MRLAIKKLIALLVIFVVLTTLTGLKWFDLTNLIRRGLYVWTPRQRLGLALLNETGNGTLHIQNNVLPVTCIIPVGGFKAWNQGVVSVIEPVVTKNCSLLFAGDIGEVDRVKTYAKKTGNLFVYSSEDKVLNDSKNCTWLTYEFSNNFYTSQEEKDFPIAFTFVVYENPQQFIRLLKVIYRPHNIYCIHLDKKASSYSKQYVASVSHCLPNVFTPRKTENVYWGHYSLIDAQMSCFSDLYDIQEVFRWKYVISLCGKELPLRTNREIVRMLKPLNGSSGIGTHVERFPKNKKSVLTSKGLVIQTKQQLGPIPHNLKLYKSVTFFSLTPNFVAFLLHNKTAIDFRDFLTNISSPEENFYASLYMIPG